MRRALLLSMIIGLIGCNSYKRAPMVNYRDNDIHEVLGSSGVYDYYDTTIHIHIILPEKRLMKKSYCSSCQPENSPPFKRSRIRRNDS